MHRLLVLALVVAGCSKAPSAEECSRSLDHLIELEIDNAGGNKGLTEEMKADLVKQKASVSEAVREQFMEACVKKTPKSIVACTISAKTLDEASKCDG
jgi:hypothetical protein